MTAPKQVDFVDGTTIVAAEFLDRIQEIQAGLAVNSALAISGTNVVLNAGSGNDVCSMTIDDKFRYIESPQVVSFSGSDSTGSYSIWATTSNTDSNPGFTLTKTAGTTIPVADNYRRIGSVSWTSATSTLSNLVQLAGYSNHGHMHTAGVDPLPSGSITTAQILDGTITLADLASSLQQLLVPTGTILAYAGSATPSSDYLLCDGSSHSRTLYANLFNALGGVASPYGLPTSSTFSVPDLRGRSILGAGSASGLTSRARGDIGGSETHTLTVGQMPAHNHGGLTGTQVDQNSVMADLSGGGNVAWVGGNNMGGGTHRHTITTDGASQAHPNMHPFLVTNYIIKV